MTQEKPRIKEIIVVEGRDDTRRLKEVFDVDTIETQGSAINAATLEKIKFAQETRGVIVFTDPDFAGEKIRQRIMAEVPSAKHAFLSKKEARPQKSGGSLGVEHASPAALKEALQSVAAPGSVRTGEITRGDLLQFGLINTPASKGRRQLLGEKLRIGTTNGKQLLKRLRMFEISKAEFIAIMKEIEEELHD